MLDAMRRATPRRLLMTWSLLAGTLFLLSAAIVVPHVAAYSTVSPIDELQHIDYVVKAGRLDLVRGGEKVGETAMREQSCRGIDSPGFVSPPCDAPVVTPEMYQEAGYNTAAIHPPTYYAATGLMARALVRLPAIDSLVTGARLAGTVWLLLGLLVTFVLARVLGASKVAASAGVVLLGTLPVVVFPSATVTPDATSLFAGGAVALATVLHLQGRVGLWTLAVGGVLATAFKSTGILAIGLCCALVMVSARGWSPAAWRPGARGWLRPLAVLAATGAVPVIGWTAVSALLSLDVPPSPMTRFEVTTLTSDQVLGNLLALAPPTQSAYVAPTLRTALLLALIGVGGYLLLGAAAAVSLNRTEDRLVDRLGGVTLAAMLAGGPFLVVLTYVVANAYVPIPPRYGLVLLPPAVAVLAVLASRTRGVLWAVSAVGGLQLVALAHAAS